MQIKHKNIKTQNTKIQETTFLKIIKKMIDDKLTIAKLDSLEAQKEKS